MGDHNALPRGNYYLFSLHFIGNLYICDESNDNIRKVVVSTGIISKIAGKRSHGYSGDGGQATSAKLNGPYGLAVDSSGIPILFAPPLVLL